MNRPLVLALVVLAGLAGCSDTEPTPPVSPQFTVSSPSAAASASSAAPTARPTASAAPKRDPRTAPTRQDVTGRYHPVTEQQTTAGATYECTPDQFFMTWELDQKGGDVGGKLVYNRNAAHAADVEYRSEFVYGTNQNGLLVLEGEYQVTDESGKPLSEDFVRVRYELRYIESTGHLVGTRNGERFYLRPILPGTEEKCR